MKNRQLLPLKKERSKKRRKGKKVQETKKVEKTVELNNIIRIELQINKLQKKQHTKYLKKRG